MYIKRFQILNFKSYRDSGVFDLSPGFNIVTGQNNAGKSSLLEALTLDFYEVPHRSLRTVPTPGAPVNPTATVRVTFSVSLDEIRRLIRGGEYVVSAPAQHFQIPGDGTYDMSEQTARSFVDWLFSENHQFEFNIIFSKSDDGVEECGGTYT